MSTNGYIKLHRKCKDCWQWTKPKWWRAWTSLMVDACWDDCEGNGLKRGQVMISVREFAKDNGMTKQEAQWFLGKCVEHGDITWEKSKGGRPKKHPLREETQQPVLQTVLQPVLQPVFSIITLLNYEIYQPPCPPKQPVSGTVSGTVLQTPSIEEKNKNPPTPRRGQRTKKAAKDEETLRSLLSEVKLDEFRTKYEPQGLDVDSCWSNFEDYVLHGNASKPFPNPSNFVDMTRAFRSSCKMAIDRGWHQLKNRSWVPDDDGEPVYPDWRRRSDA